VSLDEDENMPDIIVIGAGPAGVLAALRAAELGTHPSRRQR
jgi:flavin-dependent dehydrogenase